VTKIARVVKYQRGKVELHRLEAKEAVVAADARIGRC
jgi:hypothetical protein